MFLHVINQKCRLSKNCLQESGPGCLRIPRSSQAVIHVAATAIRHRTPTRGRTCDTTRSIRCFFPNLGVKLVHRAAEVKRALRCRETPRAPPGPGDGVEGAGANERAPSPNVIRNNPSPLMFRGFMDSASKNRFPFALFARNDVRWVRLSPRQLTGSN